MKVRIEKFNKFEFTGGRGVALEGRSEEKKYRTMVAFGPVAEALEREMVKIAGGVDQIADVHERKIVVDVEGEWKVRTVKGRAKPDFQVSAFKFLSGPSAELFRARSKACEVSAQAGRLHAQGRHEEAYLVLEEYVAMFAMVPIPSLDGVEPERMADVPSVPAAPEGTDPEAGALERFGAGAPDTDGAVQVPLPSGEPVVAEQEASPEPETEIPASAEPSSDVAEDASSDTGADAIVGDTGLDAAATNGNAKSSSDGPPADVGTVSLEAQVDDAGVPETAPERDDVPAVEPFSASPAAPAPKTGGFRPSGIGGFRPGGLAGFKPAAAKKEPEPESEPQGPRI